MRLSDLGPWAEAHHGLVSQTALAIDGDRWRRALRSGLLEPIHPGLARIPGTARSREQAIMAAVLAAGPDAIASHRSAAALWGIDRPEHDPIDVILPRRQRQPRPDAIVVHRPTDSRRLTPQRRSNIPCTNILRTLLDLGAVDPLGVEAAVQFTLGNRLAHLNALHIAVLEHARPGRSGIRALRAAVLDASLDQKPVDSVLEPAVRGLAERFGLPPMTFHPRIEGWEVDFHIVDTALILECDGWSSHGLDREQFERDRVRDDDLRAAGWIVMRFTYRAIVQRASDTARRIRRAVDRWAALAPPA